MKKTPRQPGLGTVVPKKKKSLPAPKRGSRQPPAAATDRHADLPIIGIGASAGGLEALMELFAQMPADPDMAFVVVTHQHPGHSTLLPEILGKASKIPVIEAVDHVQLQANRVYVAPSGVLVGILHGRLQLLKATDEEARHLPIDFFLRALAADQKELAGGIILSGTGTDGTLGLKAIKAEAGMVMVQEPQSAKYAGMPASAMATGLVDFVLKPAAMPDHLASYFRGPRPAAAAGEEVLPAGILQKILLLLRTRTRHDFSAYKPATIRRRIVRRMNVLQIQAPGDYVRYLQEHPSELDLVFKEFLISVTSFFRDRDAWTLLCDSILPDLLHSLPDNYNLRVWVPGCATGEEAYSMAIVLREVMDRLHRHFNVQVFGTDLDLQAIETARSGMYPQGIAADVPPPWLARYFQRDGQQFRVSKEIRQMVIFAPQNVISDPPFTKLDLVSCRNLLIYLNADLQKRLLRLFHYVLKPGGLLFLGSSETIGDHKDLFRVVDRAWKIFARRKLATTPQLGLMPFTAWTAQGRSAVAPPAPAPDHGETMARLVGQVLLRRLAPTCVLVNDRGDIVYVHGRTGQFLEPATEGVPRLNILEMAREGLELDLRLALREAATKRKEIIREAIRVRANGDFIRVALAVVRLEEPEPLRGLLLVMLRPAGPAPKPQRGKKEPAASPRVEQLLRELKETKESLRKTVEQLATSNEELRSSNEELQSTNEEMQSTNEELETSREELQALNEELTTVNSQQQAKVDDLARARDDMQNLLNSIGVDTLFLDNELRIRRFTAGTSRLINLIASDVGRPILDQTTALKHEHLADDCREVLQTLQLKEAEVETTNGSWYWMRILPYRTTENAVDGLVVTFVDITKATLADRAGRAARAFFESIVATIRQPVMVLDASLHLVTANKSFYEEFRLRPRQVEGESIYEIGAGEWADPELRTLLEKIIPRQTTVEGFKLTRDFARIGRRVFILNARRLEQTIGLPEMILLAMEDKTGK